LPIFWKARARASVGGSARHRAKAKFNISGNRAADRIRSDAIGKQRLDKSRDVFGSRHGSPEPCANSFAQTVPKPGRQLGTVRGLFRLIEAA
jgi:hypothetical protein